MQNDRDGEGEVETEIHWFNPQMPTVVGAGPGQSQEPRTLTGFPTWLTGTQISEPLSPVSLLH